MHTNLKKGLFFMTVLGAVSCSVMPASASESEKTISGTNPVAGIEAVLNDCLLQNKAWKAEEYSDMAFANVTSFLYIRSEPTRESEWVGKLYPGYAAKITGPVGEWTPVQSGDVTGYVKTEFIITGEEAQEFAEDLVSEAKKEGRENSFTYAESREQEEERLRKEQVAKVENGQAVVDYACQFIGNPYVWGGTSLTNGADCSGFVQQVYAYFGVGLPRTSYEQRSVGSEVSYDQAIPGDIVCYDGHVGIYIGDGKIVNAMNPAQGIGISPATYADILTVRRII